MGTTEEHTRSGRHGRSGEAPTQGAVCSSVVPIVVGTTEEREKTGVREGCATLQRS